MDSEQNISKAFIASREYLVIRDHNRSKMCISLSAPHKPLISTPFKNMVACTVFIEPEMTVEREVLGRDGLEALAHAILMIEARLILLTKNGELFNPDETPAHIDDFGMFFGVIGMEYRNNIENNTTP